MARSLDPTDGRHSKRKCLQLSSLLFQHRGNSISLISSNIMTNTLSYVAQKIDFILISWHRHRHCVCSDRVALPTFGGTFPPVCGMWDEGSNRCTVQCKMGQVVTLGALYINA